MYKSTIRNFPNANSGTPFASLTIQGSADQHMTTTMSTTTQEVTLFFDNVKAIRQMLDNLEAQVTPYTS